MCSNDSFLLLDSESHGDGKYTDNTWTWSQESYCERGSNIKILILKHNVEWAIAINIINL